MSLFHSILSKLQHKLSLRHADIDMVAQAVSDILRIPITPDQVSIRSGVLTLAVAPTAKMALRLKQQALIDALAAKGVRVSAIR